MQQNPNEAEEIFDRSVSMKRFRVSSENVTNLSKKPTEPRNSTNMMLNRMNPTTAQMDGPSEDRKILGMGEKKK
jgi:hypothetical protein